MLSRHATPFDLFEKLEQQLAQAERVPAAEVLETDAAFQITVELPGAAKDSIDVKATDRSLVISAERAQPEGEGEGEALVSEFRYGSWSRSFRFPKGFNAMNSRPATAMACCASPPPKRRATQL